MGVKNICCKGYPRRQPWYNYSLLGAYVKEGHAIKNIIMPSTLNFTLCSQGVMCLEQQGFSVWIMGLGLTIP